MRWRHSDVPARARARGGAGRDRNPDRLARLLSPSSTTPNTTRPTPPHHTTLTNTMQAVLGSIIGPAGPEKADLTGKVAIVTGGALGIGYEVRTPSPSCSAWCA